MTAVTDKADPSGVPHANARDSQSDHRRNGWCSPEPASAAQDAVLVRRLVAGDEAAFDGLVKQYHNPLLRLARTFVADQATAEEVVQDTWIAILNGLGRFEGRSSLKTWIFSILANRARSRAVREKRSVAFSVLSEAESAGLPAVEASRFTADGMWAIPPSHWGADSPEEQLLRAEEIALLRRAIDDLPPGQRAVVILHDVEGLASADVCQALSISGANERVLLHRARSRLRAVLERHRTGT